MARHTSTAITEGRKNLSVKTGRRRVALKRAPNIIKNSPSGDAAEPHRDSDRVYDEAGNVIRTHEHAGHFKGL